jgi:hypothetical protein
MPVHLSPVTRINVTSDDVTPVRYVTCQHDRSLLDLYSVQYCEDECFLARYTVKFGDVGVCVSNYTSSHLKKSLIFIVTALKILIDTHH